MSFKLKLEINEKLEIIENIKETDEVKEYINGYIDFIYNDTNFLANIIPTEISEFFTEIYNHQMKVPFFSFIFELGCLNLYKTTYDIFELTADFIPFSFFFINDGENTNIFLCSNMENIWYDGKRIFKSEDTPLESNFKVPNDEFFEVINKVLVFAQIEVKEKYPHLLKNIFVKMSFSPFIL